MTIDMEFSVPMERTIGELNSLLDALCLDDKYSVGGEDCLQFTSDGEVFIYEIENEDLPKMLRIIHDHGLWPSITAIYGDGKPLSPS